jgi:HSP20 family molecular chaperone IbpA
MTITYRSPIDIFETDDRYVIHADLPGVRRDDITIDLDQDSLRLSGSIKQADGKTVQAVWERSFHLTKSVDRERISAEVVDGVLCLSLPKPQESQPRRISVSAA